jgi:methanogenic corrinoid protein MtbC1
MFSIGLVSRETGISVATLRKWEQRYGFPKPNRPNGYTRSYSYEEIAKLREIKLLIDQGAKPSQVLTDDSITFKTPNESNSPIIESPEADFICDILTILIEHEIKKLPALLAKKLKKLGIVDFVEQVAHPLTIAVGEKWSSGELSIFVEHYYTQQMFLILTNALIKKERNSQNTVRVLLTTLAGEKHTLGLAMLQAVLSNENAYCINLGSELPLSEFPKAVQDYNVNIVGLSFSLAFPKRSMLTFLTELRTNLPSETALWIGGTGAKQLAVLPAGVQVLCSTLEVVTAFSEYKAQFALKSLARTYP